MVGVYHAAQPKFVNLTAPSAEARGVEEGQGELVVFHERLAFSEKSACGRGALSRMAFEGPSSARGGLKGDGGGMRRG
jgi:hypothetical protein